MNRTQRALKRSCHKALDHAKREKRMALYDRNDATWRDFSEKSEKLKAAVKNEKGLKAWHRNIIQDAGNTLNKEEKTA